MDLASAFAAALPQRTLPADVEAQLAALWEAARVAWPELPDDPAGFARALALRVDNTKDVSLELALRSTRAADLYLAMHCADGHALAIERMIAGPFSVVRATLYKLRCSAALIGSMARAEQLPRRIDVSRKPPRSSCPWPCDRGCGSGTASARDCRRRS